ncbi:MAG: hypothetical protein ABIZ70_06915 [Gemmatimonadales bacterium]
MPATAMASPVKVLKLHGSFGWYQEDSEILFENAIYLDAFRFASAGQLVPLLDPGFGVSRYQGDHLLITPAFIKNLTHPALIAIWGGASEALGSADQVDVWGYSLPDADGAARALFLPLRERVRTGTTEVRIHDPSEGTRDRWRALLGTGVTMLNESLGRDVE